MTKKSAFFVSPIGKEHSSACKRADRILEFVLEPVLGEKFEIIRADHVTSIGSINHDIVHRLHASALVVADLTNTNPNVMYEVGIRHAFNLPIVQIAQKDQDLPFDLGNERTIFFDLGDIKEVERAKKLIQATANTAMNESYLGPVQRALGLSAIYSKDETVAEAIESLDDKIDDLESSISEMLVFDVSVDANLAGGDAERLQHVYDILSSIRPYEAERMFETLRRIAFKRETKGIE